MADIKGTAPKGTGMYAQFWSLVDAMKSPGKGLSRCGVDSVEGTDRKGAQRGLGGNVR